MSNPVRKFVSDIAFGCFVIGCCIVGAEAQAQELTPEPEEEVENVEKPFDIRDLMADIEVLEVDQKRFDQPMKSGYLKRSAPSWTMFKMHVDNFRGPPGNFCVDILWFDASGLFDGEVACNSAPSSGPDIRTFTTVVAPGIPDGAELKLAFRGRYSTDFGDRIPFRGAEERRAPAIYTVTGGPDRVRLALRFGIPGTGSRHS